MSDAWETLNLAELAESVDLECKAAQGRNGLGELPEDFWKSYCAMANTDGGIILLGVQEKPRGVFRVVGIKEIERVRKALWDNLNNRKQVSANVLSEHHIAPITLERKTILRIEVPRASRQFKPVHVGSNPFGHTYLRRYEGDYLADDESVRRLLAERVEESRDDRLLKGFGLSDLDVDTLSAYRNRFSAVKPGHIWSDLPSEEFLERIGAFGKDREDGTNRLRLAGLLMFGRAEVITDVLPYYMVDYQEQPENPGQQRWLDRVVPDGTWSGNVYDFFRKVYQKLTRDLKVPFQLQDGQRIDDTPVHEALREALVNTLIHADYSGRVSLQVVKRADMFRFRNPGRMRIPVDEAIHGGNSDCRNRRLQLMFRMVGYGDHAGSGLPKIYHNWQDQHWRSPLLLDQAEPEQTLMELRMVSLVPSDVVRNLETRLGETFTGLTEVARLALITASTEGMINHTRLRQISSKHPADITKILGRLVRDGLLVSQGVGRGMVYYLPWKAPLPPELTPLTPELTPLTPELTPLTPELTPLTPELTPLTPELTPLTPELTPLTPEFDVLIAREREQASISIVHDLTQLTDTELAKLRALAAPVASKRRVNPKLVRETVLALCAGRYLGLRVLANLLGRNADGVDLRRRVLNQLVAEKALKRVYPNPNDPRQAYTAPNIHNH